MLKEQPLYSQAKAGSAEAAVELVSKIALPFIVQISSQLPSDAWYVAPHAREATGDNAIPQVLAAACASATSGLIDTDIVQISRVFHTGADPMERMATRPDFEGIVIPGADYVLIDDVTVPLPIGFSHSAQSLTSPAQSLGSTTQNFHRILEKLSMTRRKACLPPHKVSVHRQKPLIFRSITRTPHIRVSFLLVIRSGACLQSLILKKSAAGFLGPTAWGNHPFHGRA